MIFFIFKNSGKIIIGLRSTRSDVTEFYCQIDNDFAYEKLADSEDFYNFSDFSKRLEELKIDLKSDTDYQRICESIKSDKRWDLRDERIKAISAPIFTKNIGGVPYFMSPLPLGNLSRTAQALGDNQLAKWGCFTENQEDKTELLEFTKKELMELDRHFILRENQAYNIYDLAKIQLANLNDLEEIASFDATNFYKG